MSLFKSPNLIKTRAKKTCGFWWLYRFDGDLASFVILNTVVPIADAVQLHQPKAFGGSVTMPSSWFVDWEDMNRTTSGGVSTNIYPVIFNGNADPVDGLEGAEHNYTIKLGNTPCWAACKNPVLREHPGN